MDAQRWKYWNEYIDNDLEEVDFTTWNVVGEPLDYSSTFQEEVGYALDEVLLVKDPAADRWCVVDCEFMGQDFYLITGPFPSEEEAREWVAFYP